MHRYFVAHDFSQKSERALLRALRLADEGDAVRLLHCTSHLEDPTERLAKHARLLGEAQIMAEEIGHTSVQLSARLAAGDPPEAILAEAEAFDADLIVMGGHGEPRFRDAVFGTTATHVVRHGHRPVLIVQEVGLAAYPEMMIAIDDPLDARHLLSAALAVAPAAPIKAIHAYSPTLVQTLVGSVELEQQERRLQRQIAQAFAEAGRSDAIEVVVEMGEVLSVIMHAYERRQPALMVMGTRAHATYLGSHAVDTLFWCPGDLLVVPERGALIESALPAAHSATLY